MPMHSGPPGDSVKELSPSTRRLLATAFGVAFLGLVPMSEVAADRVVAVLLTYIVQSGGVAAMKAFREKPAA